MKKLAFLVVAGALAIGACGKKNDGATTTPTGTGDMGNEGGGDAYGAQQYGAPTTPDPANPCGGAANPCG